MENILLGEIKFFALYVIPGFAVAEYFILWLSVQSFKRKRGLLRGSEEVDAAKTHEGGLRLLVVLILSSTIWCWFQVFGILDRLPSWGMVDIALPMLTTLAGPGLLVYIIRRRILRLERTPRRY